MVKTQFGLFLGPPTVTGIAVLGRGLYILQVRKYFCHPDGWQLEDPKPMVHKLGQSDMNMW